MRRCRCGLEASKRRRSKVRARSCWEGCEISGGADTEFRAGLIKEATVEGIGVVNLQRRQGLGDLMRPCWWLWCDWRQSTVVMDLLKPWVIDCDLVLF
ncbi:hypothetical protein M0R45_030933 [Rubus argutus]|uniref:Uncharacterized protein n=1 Tax=Rubus argutus TaxID=59490 RepID=A0AAW1WGT1_RUBAR